MRLLRGLPAPFIVAATALSASLLLAPPAWAHDQVVSTSPEAGASVSNTPVVVEIVTSGNLLDLGGNSAGFAITVTDDSGLFYGDGCVSVEGPSLSSVAALGDSGQYTVTYQYVSGDGHTLSGQYDFFYERPEGELPSAGQAQAPTCGEDPVYPQESTSAPVDETPAPESPADELSPGETTPDSSTTMPWITPIVLAGIAVVLIGTMSYLFITYQRGRRNNAGSG